MSSPIITWGAIGAGDVFERKSGAPLYQVSRSKLHGLTRRDSVSGAQVAEKHGCRFYASPEALLATDEVNAVYIATPPQEHLEHALLACPRPTLVEKPMAMSTAECLAMVEAFEGARAPLAVAYYRRGYPSIQKLRNMTRNTVGQWHIHLNDTFPTSHRVDLVQALLGEIQSIGLETPTQEDASFRHTEGPVIVLKCLQGTARLTSTWGENGTPERIHLCYGEKVMDLIDLKQGLLLVDGELQKCGTLPWTHWGCVENVVAHLLDGEPLLCDGREGLKSTAVLDVVSCLQVGEQQPFDVAHCPQPNLERSAELGLLG